MKFTAISIAIALFVVLGAFIIGSSFAGGLKVETEAEDATQKGANVLTCSDTGANGEGFVQLGGNNQNCN
jgi:uncharacterized protein YdgA (DUF945 family)